MVTVHAAALATFKDLVDQETGEIQTTRQALQPVFIRTAFNYDRDQASLDSGLACHEPTKAQQQFKEDSDINVIVNRFGLTGELPTNVRMPTYEDFTGVVNDFHTAANAVRAAEEAFAAMPADVRTRFSNDPGRFVDFCSDESNRPEAEKLGLVLARKPQEPPKDSPPQDPPPAK
jgi:phage internal scaffolding protein